MSTVIIISNATERLVQDITREQGCNHHCVIKYGPGYGIGDGLLSKSAAVDVEAYNMGERSLHLFVKVPLEYDWHRPTSIDRLFANEIHFYKTIYPAFRSFLAEIDSGYAFGNAPKCYGTHDTQYDEAIVLDDLKLKGFTFFDKKKLMGDNQIVLVMETFAKLHAISFVFKEQKTVYFDGFVRKIDHCAVDLMTSVGFDKLTQMSIRELIKSLDPVEDAYLMEASRTLEEKLIDIFLTIDERHSEYSIITQSDCWINNLMFLYDEEDAKAPLDIMLVDWQLIRYGSPTIGLAYFFYTVASEATIENLEYYLQAYHDELSRGIEQLGSDPRELYPYCFLEEEWQEFAKYGFAMAFITVRAMYLEKDEFPDSSKYPKIFGDGTNDCQTVFPTMRNKHMYMKRLKAIFKHFVRHDFL